MTEPKIYRHSTLEPVADGVWRVIGNQPIPLHRNMIVVRLPSGDLVLHSLVAMDEPGLGALEKLGRPAYAIVPSRSHQSDAPFYKKRYPDIRILTPSAIREFVEPNVTVDATVEETLPGLGFVLHAVPGLRVNEFVYEFGLPGGGYALIVNDAFGGANAYDASRLLGRAVVKYLGAPGNRFGIPRILRMRVITDAAALKAFAAKLAEIPDLRLITLSHGDPVRGSEAAGALRAVAA